MFRILWKVAACAVAAIGLHSPAFSAETWHFSTDEYELEVETLVEGLEYPWGVEIMPDGRFLITEKVGNLRIFDGKKLSASISGLPKLHIDGQAGLLDVALSPDFKVDRQVFLTATQAYDHGIGVSVIRGKLAENDRQLTDVQIIFRSSHPDIVDHNFGSRLAFAPDGTLFVTVGDQAREKLAQDPFDSRGTVVHINPDGSIPKDNPFADGKMARPELWSLGHRNPQGIYFETSQNRLYTVEHGPKGGDEINMPEAGKNYGWPIITYGVDYSGAKVGIGTHKEGMEQPLFYWDPSIAPSALLIYHGKMFPKWEGDIFVSALKFALVSRLTRNGDGKITEKERLFADEFGRLRDIKEAPDGSLLLLTDEDEGRLLRVYKAPAP